VGTPIKDVTNEQLTNAIPTLEKALMNANKKAL
jgi:hypothetical protein